MAGEGGQEITTLSARHRPKTFLYVSTSDVPSTLSEGHCYLLSPVYKEETEAQRG